MGHPLDVSHTAHSMKVENYPHIFHANLKVDHPGFVYERNPMVCDAEMELLLHVCRGKKNVLEIGTWRGITTDNILRVADHVVSIDVTEPPATITGGQSANECLPIAEIGASVDPSRRDRLMLRQYNPNMGGELSMLLENIGDQYDLVIIDGDHSEWGVNIDFNATKLYLAPNGFMIFHDCWWDVNPAPVNGPLRLLQREGGLILNGTHYGILTQHLDQFTINL